VLTLAVSLSIQNALSNVIGGFTLLYTKPFKSGDFVEIAEESGTVEEIGMSYTKLITPDNKVIHIPNSAVVAADIINYTVSGTRRVELIISASYDAPTEAVKAACWDAINATENVLQDPAPAVVLTNYGSSSIEYTILCWTEAPNFLGVKNGINEKLREPFAAHNVEMTYDHLNVHVVK
jgi:small conductance mechanosensitive channel